MIVSLGLELSAERLIIDEQPARRLAASLGRWMYPQVIANKLRNPKLGFVRHLHRDPGRTHFPLHGIALISPSTETHADAVRPRGVTLQGRLASAAKAFPARNHT